MYDGDETVGKSPQECRDSGLWEVDVVYYSLTGNNKNETSKNKRGKAYKARNDSEYKCFEAHDGVLYRPGDHVFVELSQCEPFLIGTITHFKMAKREQLTVKLTRFYRPEDVPEDSYSLLMQERQDDATLNHAVLDALQHRELFSSETPLVYPIWNLRGKCTIRLVKDVRTLGERSSADFFALVSFDPANSRLASVQGEIRVGASYQAKVPAVHMGCAVDDADRDQLVWRPGYIRQDSEHVYQRATRSFRMFAMLRNQHVTATERDFCTGDLCTYDAILALHQCGYNVNQAIECMNVHDERMLNTTTFMSADDAKRFARGIKMYGKNFVKIKKELLPHHDREQLVQFYYGWKKTRDATRPKPLTRQRNATAVSSRKPKHTHTKCVSSQLADYASASETELGCDAVAYACHHCYSSKSRDWHHCGKQRQLMCTECRLFYKKYAQLRPVERPSTVPPALHKPSSPHQDYDDGVKTRACKKERREVDNNMITPPNLDAVNKRKRNHASSPEQMNGDAKRRLLISEEDTPVKVDDEMIPATAEGLAASPESSSTTGCSVGAGPSSESDPDDCCTQGNSVVHTSTNASFIRVIERRCGQRSARTDLAYSMKLGCDWASRREQRQHAKSKIERQPALCSNDTMPRVPINGLPVFVADPRVVLLNQQQQYATALAIEQQAAMHKMEQHMRMELMRNGAVTPSRETPPRLLPPPYQLDPRALAQLMHNPSQFGMALDSHAAMMSALEQQRMLAGIEMGLTASQAHVHAHTMLQHAQSNELHQLLALSAAQQRQPFDMLSGDLARMNPALNSDMMRRLQQEGGFTPPQQHRP